MRFATAQRGLALVVVLMFLVSITTIAVFAARKAMLSEGTGRNQLDMETARLAAESALRDAERDLQGAVVNLAKISCTRAPVWLASEDCNRGFCRKNSQADYSSTNWSTATPTNKAVSEPWWPASHGGSWNDTYTGKPSRTPVNTLNCDSFTGGVPLGTYTGVDAIAGVALQPEYLIEYFQKATIGNPEGDAYRITARGFGYSRRTQVVLQTVFVPLD